MPIDTKVPKHATRKNACPARRVAVQAFQNPPGAH